MSSSSIGTKRGVNSAISTSVPKEAKKEANSQPIAPPPITKIDLGISFIENTSFDDRIFPSTRFIKGCSLCTEPVAITILEASIISWLSPSILIEVSPTKEAFPYLISTFAFFNLACIPDVKSVIKHEVFFLRPSISKESKVKLTPVVLK